MPGNRPPKYPVKDRLAGNQGTVNLVYYVTKDGQVQHVQLVRSSGHRSLDAQAIDAISKYRYVPGQEGRTYHPVMIKLRGDHEVIGGRLRTQPGEGS